MKRRTDTTKFILKTAAVIGLFVLVVIWGIYEKRTLKTELDEEQAKNILLKQQVIWLKAENSTYNELIDKEDSFLCIALKAELDTKKKRRKGSRHD